MSKAILGAAISAVIYAGALNAASIEILDKTHNPAGQFLAYTEFELSGEPLAEALGLDLDTLDPNRVDDPTAFDFAAGIESYEYSEEAMYALNYQSTMGPHRVVVVCTGILPEQHRGRSFQSILLCFFRPLSGT